MKTQISILIVAASLGTSVAIAQQTEHEKQKYTCVMHPEVVMDHPGKCTKCGMTLVPLKPKSKRPTSNVQRPILKFRTTMPNLFLPLDVQCSMLDVRRFRADL